MKITLIDIYNLGDYFPFMIIKFRKSNEITIKTGYGLFANVKIYNLKRDYKLILRTIKKSIR